MTGSEGRSRVRETRVEVVRGGRRARKDWIPFADGHDFKFSTEALRFYACAEREEVICDAMVLCASIEFTDAVARRPAAGWARSLFLLVPVQDADRWNAKPVKGSLHCALNFLTGDSWHIRFVKKLASPPGMHAEPLPLDVSTKACMAFSEGLDSITASGILSSHMGSGLVRVRVQRSSAGRCSQKTPFVRVPYSIANNRKSREPSRRSRGFRFALISGIAAYLTGTQRVIVPESGQGSLGPAVVTVGHEYPDYRSHPLFTGRMEPFLRALLGKRVRYEFPHLWNTKGETLREFVRLNGEDWQATRSCWRDSRWISVAGKRRQCGVCAACMLRRLSVHAAGLDEPRNTYVCENMTAPTVEKATAPGFKKMNGAFREYAIAGTRHMEDLAELGTDSGLPELRRHASMLDPEPELGPEETFRRMRRMFARHREEWRSYLADLGPRSFVRDWIFQD